MEWGVVYRAEDMTLQRRVAPKFMLGDLAAQEDLRIRFLREARTSAALILRGLATIELLARDYPAAEKRMRDQLAQGPARLVSYRLLGSILAEEGKFAEAERLAQKVVALDASRASHNLLAWILVAGGLDIDRGVETARQAPKIPANYEEPSETYPFTPVAEHTLGLAALKKGSNAEAVKLLEAAARLRPDRESIREDLEHARRSAK